MSVSLGHLDPLLNQTFGGNSLVNLTPTSDTTQGAVLTPSYQLTSFTGNIGIAAGLGQSYKVISVNDSLNTITVAGYIGSTPVTQSTFAVDGFTSNSIFLWYGHAGGNALDSVAWSSPTGLTGIVFELSSSDLSGQLGQSQTFYVNGSYGGPDVAAKNGASTVLLTGPIGQYAIVSSGASPTITDTVAGRDGTVSISGVQQAQFSDVTAVFDLHSSQDLLVYELYQAAYGRTPDNAGFRYWASIADTNHTSALTLADNFLAAPEFTQLYGANPTNTAYVTELYTHVLGRAPDAGGLSYWVSQANAGLARDSLLVAFATSSENVQLIGSHTANGYWTTG